jgi:enoyl-CoA hydratase/carnithine racemase
VSDAAGGASILSLREAVERLQSPYAPEEFAILTGSGVLVVDLPAEGGADGAVHEKAAIDAFVVALGELACPTVALCPAEPSSVSRDVAPHFDLLLEGGASMLRQLLLAIGDHPQAALALVQLLRHNEHISVHEGLVAESLVYSVLQSGPEFAYWRDQHAPGPAPPAREPAVLVERHGSTLDLTLNQPERHNAFSLRLRDAVVEGLQLAASDASIKEVVLRGAGRSFSSGGDLGEFGDFTDPSTAHAVRSTRSPARLLASLADKTRAEVHGACIGAGMELPAFLHHVSAAPGTYFRLPEVAMGLVPGAGGTVSLPRRIGRQRTAWLAITGERVDLERALAWGLVDEIQLPVARAHETPHD